MCYPLLWFLLSDGPSRCSFRTTRGCRLYRSSHVGCRFGRSGSSGFVDVFRLLRWSGCVPVPRGRCCRDRCGYRYIYRPKRIRFPLRGRSRLNHAGMTFLKLLCLSDGLAGVLCLNPTYGYYMIQFYLASRLY